MRTGIWLFPDAAGPELVRAAERAERDGIDELWLGDEGPARDPFSLLAAMAVSTTRLGLALGVTNPYLRHPAVTAATAATIAELSGGRFTLGLGPGGQLALGPVGVAPSAPLTDCTRALEVIRAVLEGRAIDGFEPPSHAIAAPTLPVYVGARGERFNRWASAAADGAFVAGVAPATVPTVVGWARSVRPIAVTVHVSACLDDDDFEAVRPRMIHAFADAPPALRARARLDEGAVRQAAEALSDGDDRPACELMTDGVVDMVLARPERVVDTCVDVVASVGGVDAIGLAIMGDDPVGQVGRAAAVLEEVRERCR